MMMHVAVAKEKVEISEPALKVLKAYFMISKNDDISRRTMRLWDSLERLTACHAKLLLRSKAKIIDAVAVVMLMENQEECMSASHHVGFSKAVQNSTTTPLASRQRQHR